jgi:hypothetical protein
MILPASASPFPLSFGEEMGRLPAVRDGRRDGADGKKGLIGRCREGRLISNWKRPL